MSVEYEDHPFWDFSLRVYGKPGVPDACIALQERRGIDVNLVLFCAWNGESGRGRLIEAEIDTAIAATKHWNTEIVCHLRAVRDRLKDGLDPVRRDYSDALRKDILKIEVACEHAEQLTLASAVDRVVDGHRDIDARAEDAVANIAAYFHRHGFAPDADDAGDAATILAAAFPGCEHEDLAALCLAAGA